MKHLLFVLLLAGVQPVLAQSTSEARSRPFNELSMPLSDSNARPVQPDYGKYAVEQPASIMKPAKAEQEPISWADQLYANYEVYYWLLGVVGYLVATLTIMGVAQAFPVFPLLLLNGLYWLSNGLLVLLMGIECLTDWTCHGMMLPTVLLLVSGLLAGARTLLGLSFTPLLSGLQAILTGLVAPVLVFLAVNENPKAGHTYADTNFVINVWTRVDVSFQEEGPIEHQQLDVYRTHCLFDHRVRMEPFRFGSDKPDWWKNVSGIEFNDETDQGQILREGEAISFHLIPN